MSTFDVFKQAEESIVRYFADYKGRKIAVYDIRLSNATQVLDQCLDVVTQDTKKREEFLIIFNAKHLRTEPEAIKTTSDILNRHKDLLFSKKLLRFAIIVKSFIIHRKLIDAFDKLFADNKMDRQKYTYFSFDKKDHVYEWLTS